MNRFERITELERGEIDLKTGSFPMVLATEGEASDGDILSIRGGIVPARMPLLQSHINDPSSALGSVTDPKKAVRERPHKIRATGHIELEGDGPLADIRRDVAFMISQGHINAVSVRWEAIRFTRRVNLPKNHPAYVTEDESDPRKRYGVFFEAWRAQEGSVVAVGADPKALIGRSDETKGEVQSFWRSMAETTKRDGIANARDALYQITQAVDAAKDQGFKWADLVNAIWTASGFGDDADNLRAMYLENGRSIFLPVEVVEELLKRELAAKDELLSYLRVAPEDGGEDFEEPTQTVVRGPRLPDPPVASKEAQKPKPRKDNAEIVSAMFEEKLGTLTDRWNTMFQSMLSKRFPGSNENGT